jgi:hypothetical protein
MPPHGAEGAGIYVAARVEEGLDDGEGPRRRHGGPDVGGPRRLRRRAGQIHGDGVARDDHLRAHGERLETLAPALEVGLIDIGAVGQLADRVAHARLGAVHQLGHRQANGEGAIACRHRLDALRGLPARADHCLEVALPLAHAAHVGEDQVQRGVVGAPAIDDADRRDPDTLLEDLRRAAGQAPRAHAADVAPVRPHHGEDEELVRAADAGGEERGDHRHVVQVRAAGVRVVVQEDVARVDVVAELLADRAHRPADGHDVQRVVLALGHGHDLGLAVHEHAGEVLALVEDGRVRGAHEGDAHLAHDRHEGLAQDLERDGVDHAASVRSRIRLPWSSTSPAQPGGITVVAPNSSTMAGPARRAPSGSFSRSHTGQLVGAPSNQIGRRSTSASSSEAVALR